jgi:hypothetical protein
MTLTGTIAEAGPEGIRLATDGGEEGVMYDAIISARLVADWDVELRRKAQGRR